MNIRINENWRLTADSHQWIIERKAQSKREPGTNTPERWRQVAYVRDLFTACVSVRERILREQATWIPGEDLIALLHAHARLEKDIRKMVDAIGTEAIEALREKTARENRRLAAE